jgi:hypothetical protein
MDIPAAGPAFSVPLPLDMAAVTERLVIRFPAAAQGILFLQRAGRNLMS